MSQILQENTQIDKCKALETELNLIQNEQQVEGENYGKE